MNAVFIVVAILLAGLVVFALCKLGTLESRIDDIYNKALTMQGEIEANTARSQENYKLIAQVNTELDYIKSTVADLHKKEPVEDPAKEVEEELENLVVEQDQTEEDIEELHRGNLASYELSVRRENFAHLRNLGNGVKEAGEIVGVSYTTAKRYEQWRKDNKK